MTETILRSLLHEITNISPNEILDVYIDDRRSHQNYTVQCLVYFINVITAGHAINLLRGKQIQTKRIQVDFASKTFITRFSDIIQEAQERKRYARVLLYLTILIFKSL